MTGGAVVNNVTHLKLGSLTERHRAVTSSGRSERVTVHLDARLDLPLTFPGPPEAASVGASGSAVVDPG